MLAVSSRFLEQLREPHVAVVQVWVVPADGSDPYTIEVAGGSVRCDRRQQVRRTCTLELAAKTAAELAALPYGSYVDVRRGVRFGDRSTEVPRLGWLRVDGVTSSTPDGTAGIDASDRMAQVRDEPLLAPYAAGGRIASAAIVDLVDDVFPGVTSHVSTAGEPVLADVTYTDDRAAAVAQLAQAINAEAFFNVDGELVVAPAPDPSSPAVWSVDAGEHGVLIGYTDARDRTSTANGVLVRGQATADAPPIEVLVHDDDPSSPTLYGGPFGKVVAVIESTAVQTVAQATTLAQSELAKRLGLTRTLQLTSAPNPALEPDDVVEVVLADGTVEQHVVDAVTIPLDVTTAVQLETRRGGSSSSFAAVAGDAAWSQLRGARYLSGGAA